MAKSNSIRDCVYDIQHFAITDDLGFDTAVYFCEQWYDDNTILKALMFLCDNAEDFIFTDKDLSRYIKERFENHII